MKRERPSSSSGGKGADYLAFKIREIAKEMTSL